MRPSKLMSLPLREFLTPTTTFRPGDTVSKVIGFLRNTRLYEAFIEDGESTALVAVRDILGASSIDKTRLSNLMYRIPRLSPGDTVRRAATLMHDLRVRSLPMYEGRRLLGQVTAPSIVARLLDSDLGLKVSAIMTPKPTTVLASDSVSKARQIMVKRKFDQLPVMGGETLQGIISSEQIVFNLMPWTDRNVKGDWREGRFENPLSSFAEKDVVTSDI